MSIALLFAGVSTLLLLWYFGGYPLLMGITALRTESPNKDLTSTPFITIIVPTYNEETVVAQRVTNISELSYPEHSYEVLFVDSNSKDRTVPRLKEHITEGKHPEMRVLTESERRGKASAINTAIEAATGEIVLVSDANTWFDDEVLQMIGAHFNDPAVGGVAGRLKRSDGNIPTTAEFTASNQVYHDLEHIKSMGESRLDSVTQFVGEISAWRKSIATANPSSLAEDLDLSIQIRKEGYEIRYEPEAVVYEPDPDVASEQVEVNKRRLIGVLQAIVRHWRFLGTPTDYYRALIFPSRKTLQLLSPILFICLGGALTILLSVRAYQAFSWYLGLTTIGALGLASALQTIKSRVISTESSPSVSMATGVSLVKYLILMEYVILLSWAEFLLGRYSVRWDKSNSDRDMVNNEMSDREHNN
ncbi:glycosyltransferase [Halorussus sp. JP-T4]|uniref:glycosyltransferase n=1 Tax=Halorussus sp. JP-T4 TaxID=2716718 RepID=UPI0034E972CD